MIEEESKKPVKPEDYFGDPEDPNSFINRMPWTFYRKIDKMDPAFFEMDEDELYQKIRPFRRKKVARVRMMFWNSYERVMNRRHDKRNRMSINDINKIYGSSKTIERLAENPEEVAYVLRPFDDYKTSLLDLLHIGVDEMRKILESPMIDEKTGRVDSKLADVKRRIFVDVSDRVHGMPTQHIEQKSLNLNKELGPEESQPRTVEEIDRKIQELEAKQKDLTKQEREVIEGTCETVEES